MKRACRFLSLGLVFSLMLSGCGAPELGTLPSAPIQPGIYTGAMIWETKIQAGSASQTQSQTTQNTTIVNANKNIEYAGTELIQGAVVKQLMAGMDATLTVTSVAKDDTKIVIHSSAVVTMTMPDGTQLTLTGTGAETYRGNAQGDLEYVAAMNLGNTAKGLVITSFGSGTLSR